MDPQVIGLHLIFGIIGIAYGFYCYRNENNSEQDYSHNRSESNERNSSHERTPIITEAEINQYSKNLRDFKEITQMIEELETKNLGEFSEIEINVKERRLRRIFNILLNSNVIRQNPSNLDQISNLAEKCFRIITIKRNELDMNTFDHESENANGSM